MCLAFVGKQISPSLSFSLSYAGVLVPLKWSSASWPSRMEAENPLSLKKAQQLKTNYKLIWIWISAVGSCAVLRVAISCIYRRKGDVGRKWEKKMQHIIACFSISKQHHQGWGLRILIIDQRFDRANTCRSFLAWKLDDRFKSVLEVWRCEEKVKQAHHYDPNTVAQC